MPRDTATSKPSLWKARAKRQPSYCTRRCFDCGVIFRASISVLKILYLNIIPITAFADTCKLL